MEIRELQYFMQIVKDGSYTKAAEHLYLSQPALSKTIKKLERELGVKLFEKRGSGFVLTDHANVLADRARGLLNEHDNIIHAVQDTVHFTNGTVRVGMSPIVGSLFFAPIIASYCDDHPGVEVVLTEGGSQEICRNVAQRELDVGICIPIVDNPALQFSSLIMDEMVACVHVDNPLSRQEIIRFEDLRNERVNLYSAGYHLREQIARRSEIAGFCPKINFSSSQSIFLLNMTSYGSGVSILPRPYAVAYANQNVQIRSFSPVFVWQISLVTNKDHYLSYAVREFIERTRKTFKELGY